MYVDPTDVNENYPILNNKQKFVKCETVKIMQNLRIFNSTMKGIRHKHELEPLDNNNLKECKRIK